MNGRASSEQGSLLSLNPQALLGWESWMWSDHGMRGLTTAPWLRLAWRSRQTLRVESVGHAHRPFRLQGPSQLCTLVVA